jgi:hypothetical protein
MSACRIVAMSASEGTSLSVPDPPRHRLASPRNATIVLLVALTLAFGGWIVFTVATNQPLDFNVYYLAAEAYARGEDPYAISDVYPSPEWDAIAADLGITHFAKPYRYPPQTAVLVMLLRPLGPVTAVAVWDCVNAVAMILAAWLLGRVLGGGWWVPASLAGLLLCGPAYDTLMMGQINGLLLATLVVALWLLRRGSERAAGVSLAIGGVLKLVPIILVFYLLLRRRWGLAAGWLVASVVLTLICIPFIGWGGVVAYVNHAIDLTRPNSLFTGQGNQTLSGVFGRVIADPDLARLLARVVGAALLVGTLLFCWPRGTAARWLALEFAVVVAVIGLVFPFTWYHQLVVLLIPLLVLAQELLYLRRRGIVVVLVTLSALTSLYFAIWSSVAPLHYRGWGASALGEIPFLFGLCLWIVGGVVLLRGKGIFFRESGTALAADPGPYDAGALERGGVVSAGGQDDVPDGSAEPA